MSVDQSARISDRIRAFHAQGHTRSEIAKLVDRSYQQVRQVLMEDARRASGGRSPSQAIPTPSNAQGVSEPSATFGGVHRLNVQPDGSVRLPPEVQAVLGVRPGGVLIAELSEDRLVILNGRAAMARIDAIMAPFRIQGGPLVSEELIAERRAEAARESND